MAVLNSFTQQIGLGFAVQSVKRVAVPSSILHGWSSGNAADRQMKQYRQGNAQTLNIYVAGSNPNSGQASVSDSLLTAHRRNTRSALTPSCRSHRFHGTISETLKMTALSLTTTFFPAAPSPTTTQERCSFKRWENGQVRLL